MSAHTIICRNCNTKVARTPNQVCIKCKAPKWGYTDAELSGSTPQPPPQTNAQSAQQQGRAQASAVTPEIICKNCHLRVLKTPDNKCSNCAKPGWGYSARQLQQMFGKQGTATPGSMPAWFKPVIISSAAVIVLAVAALFWNKKFSTANIYDKYHKSVVMLYSEYTYKFTINGTVHYFKYKEGDDNLGFYSKPSEETTMRLTGTGFFIDKQGRIITNRHVVHHLSSDDEQKCRSIIRKLCQEKRANFKSQKDVAGRGFQVYTELYTKYETQNYIDSANVFRARQDSLGVQETIWNNIGDGVSDAKFDVELIYLGYVVDGATASDNRSAYKECHLLNFLKDDNIDLALIQDINGRLPDETINPIDINDLSDKTLKVGDNVTLLGYNAGLDIGKNGTGLHVQKIDGKVSQEKDQNRVLYSINALPGSSGSPVFTDDGRLVAVNYFGGSGFTYGVLATHIQKLLNSN